MREKREEREATRREFKRKGKMGHGKQKDKRVMKDGRGGGGLEGRETEHFAGFLNEGENKHQSLHLKS
jgi:hypothetical protein